MSCHPADPRRSPVPGPESGKFATEDLTEVGDQASVSVNATGNKKKLVQQAFHPGLFMKTKSMSMSNIPNTQTKESSSQLDAEMQQSDLEIVTQCSHISKPPDWQRVPMLRHPKKRKLSSTPSPELIKTTNSFSGLPIDQPEYRVRDAKDKKTNKPPPIILYGIEDVHKLTELLETAADRSKFSYKIISRSQLKVLSVDLEIYKKVITVIREHGLIGHTFNRKDQRCYRIVIRNLHHTTPTTAIKEAIEESGNTVVGEIINAKFGPDKKPTSTFFVNLLQGPNNRASRDIRFIYHQAVTIEEPRKRSTVVQCQRCQQYGHTKNYCMKPYRCVKCAGPHKTSECTKVDRNTPALCALCLGPHPANYKGCEVYKEILTRKTSQHLPRKHKQFEHKPQKNKEETDNKTSANLNKEVNELLQEQRKVHEHKSYADTVRSKVHQNNTNHQPDSYKVIEQMFIKQSQKIDTVLQQMSTLLELIAVLVSKLTK